MSAAEPAATEAPVASNDAPEPPADDTAALDADSTTDSAAATDAEPASSTEPAAAASAADASHAADPAAPAAAPEDEEADADADAAVAAEDEDPAEHATYTGVRTPLAGEFPALSQEEEAAFLSWAQAHQGGFVPEDAVAAQAREEAREEEKIRREEEEKQRAAREERRREREEKKALAAEREAQQQQLAAQQAAAAATVARVSQRSRISARQSNSPTRGGGGSGGGALAAPAAAAESASMSPVRATRAPLSPSVPEPFSSLSALAPSDSRSRHMPIGAALSGSASAAALPRPRGPSHAPRQPIELKDRKWLSTQHDIAAQNAFLLGRLLAIGQGSNAYYDASHGMKGEHGAFVPPKPAASGGGLLDSSGHRTNGWDDDARNMLASRRRILLQNAQFKRRRTQAKIDRENAMIQERLLKAKHSQAIDPRNHRKSYEAHQHYRELRSHYCVAPSSADNAFATGDQPPACEAAQALGSSKDNNPAATRYTSEQTRQLYTSLSAPNLHGGPHDAQAAHRARQLMREFDEQQQQQQDEEAYDDSHHQPEEKSSHSYPAPGGKAKGAAAGAGASAGPKNFRAAGGHAYALTPQSIQELMEHVFFAQQQATQDQQAQRRAQTGQRLKPLPVASRSYPQSALGPGVLSGHVSPLAAVAATNLRGLEPLKNTSASKALQAAALRRAAKGGVVDAPRQRPPPAAAPAGAANSPYSKQFTAASSTRSPAAGSTAAPSDRSLARQQQQQQPPSQQQPSAELSSQLAAALGAGQQATVERDLARQARRSPGEEKQEAAHLLSAEDQGRVDGQIAAANSASSIAAEDRRRRQLGRSPSTFGCGSPDDMQDLDPEEDASDEAEDAFDDAKCLTTPLNVKSLTQFMRPVNGSKKEYSEEELDQ